MLEFITSQSYDPAWWRWGCRLLPGGEQEEIETSPAGAYPSCSRKVRELPSLKHSAGVFIARYWTFHFYSGTTGLFSAWPLTPSKDWGYACLEHLRTSNAPLFDICLADEGAFPPTSCLAFSASSHPQVLWGWYPGRRHFSTFEALLSVLGGTTTQGSRQTGMFALESSQDC